jgi:hypothetical protein
MMEISPIPGIRALPAMRSKAANPGLPGIFETEYLARTDDESYSSNNGNPAGGQEDAFDESSDESEAPAEPLGIPVSADGPPPKINLFV